MSSNEQTSLLIDNETQALLSAIGNHEAKSLVAAVINTQPNSNFSIRQLEREMISRQGDSPAWSINSGTISDYCTQTLLPLGAVDREQEAYGGRGRWVYSASEFGNERGIPFAGAVMEWSLMYPEHSVQKLLGITAVAGESARSPTSSYLVMQELVTNPGDGEISVASIGRAIGRNIDDSRVVEEHLQRLVCEKFVELRTNIQDYNPVFRINRNKAEDIVLTHNISIAIRNVWLATEKDEMALSEILDVVSMKHPDLASSDVREVMTYVVARQRLPFLEVTDRNGTPKNKSSVKLTSTGRKIMGEFVEMIEASETDEQSRFRGIAVDVVSDTEKFRQLMDKARRSSNSATTALSQAMILDELKTAGKVTVSGLRESLAVKGIKVGSASVRRYLAVMGEDNLVETESIPLSMDLKRRVVHYRLSE